ncbi:Heat shock protein 70 [Aspergillus oryzae]|uniref:Heat shock protein 70 n=2 Tax=Aspergillus oryzae TaxID=5062 RepID=A0A1S9DT68_ASPOZ|nr:Heat shock protein 70 [Aspergillus oryzae]
MIFNLWILGLGLGLFLAADARGPQPIGIDLGPELLTAAYAHTSDNVSVIAAIAPGPEDIYVRHMLLLRMEYADRHDIMRPWRKPAQWTLKGHFSNLIQQWTTELSSFLDKPALQNSQMLSFASTGFRTVLQAVSYTRRLVNPGYKEELRLVDVKAGLVDMLRQLKQKAATDSDVDLNYAVIAVPEFFNQTLREMVVDASRKAGIRSALTPVSRTTVATFVSTSTIANPPGLRYAVIDHGMFYLDVSAGADTGKSERERIHQYFPALHMGSTMIDSYITDRLVNRVEDLSIEIAIGTSKTALYGPVRQARTLIRDDLDSQLLGSENDQDHHFDEYPLDLTKWGSGQSQAVLSWEDVHAAERRFVEVVATNLRTYLAVLRFRRLPDASPDDIIPEVVDRVVILTTGPDGHLLAQAVREGLGDHIEIIGGTLRESFSLAAFGAARGALVAMSPGIYRNTPKQRGVFDHEL